MGCFDSVVAVCPDCEADVEFQSKAGFCRQDSFWVGSVPDIIALDIDGDDIECQCCGCIVTIRFPGRHPKVAMTTERG